MLLGRFCRFGCLLAYFIVRLGSPNEGTVKLCNLYFFWIWTFYWLADFMCLGCWYVWMRTTCLCCIIFMVLLHYSCLVWILFARVGCFFVAYLCLSHRIWFSSESSVFLIVRSIKELVKVEKNGLLFSSSSELADELLVSLGNVHFVFFVHMFPCAIDVSDQLLIIFDISVTCLL